MVKDKPDVELPEFPFKNKQPFLEGKRIFLWPDAFSQTTGRNGRYVDLGSIRGIRLVNPSPKILFSSCIVSPLSSHNRFYPGYGWISDNMTLFPMSWQRDMNHRQTPSSQAVKLLQEAL
ncbi:hypothetical protein HYY74_07690 [Candidatus Woesearchaeota archaeon]|nr:hypothetical protein [Candidatus Woesearchaeota archaeon]